MGDSMFLRYCAQKSVCDQNLLSRLGLASVPPRTLVTLMRLEALTNPLAGRSHG